MMAAAMTSTFWVGKGKCSSLYRSNGMKRALSNTKMCTLSGCRRRCFVSCVNARTTGVVAAVTKRKKMIGEDERRDGMMHRGCYQLVSGVLTSVDCQNSQRLLVVASATEGEANAGSQVLSITADERNGQVIDDSEFNISQVSFGTIGSTVGLVFLVYGFVAYFGLVPGGAFSSLILTYGFPITILGFALKYAELKPVECTTYSKAASLRERQVTPILKQVKDDVTRFRYGDEQHLDLAMERIFRIGRGGGVSRRECPVLKGVREEVSETNGNYSLVLEFEAKKLGLEGFEKYREKFQTFFGPGITAEVKKSAKVESMVDVLLISDGDSVGGQEEQDTEILPPLMPGMPARRQQKK